MIYEKYPELKESPHVVRHVLDKVTEEYVVDFLTKIVMGILGKKYQVATLALLIPDIVINYESDDLKVIVKSIYPTTYPDIVIDTVDSRMVTFKRIAEALESETYVDIEFHFKGEKFLSIYYNREIDCFFNKKERHKK